MGSHEEFLELSAAATAGELSVEEQAKLDVHLAICPECRRARKEYELAAVRGMAALAEGVGLKDPETDANTWSVKRAEEAFFKRLDRERKEGEDNRADSDLPDKPKAGQRFAYRPSNIRWREVWMPFAAAILLALALGIAAYRSELGRGTDVARTVPAPAKDSAGDLEEQASDAGYERAQLLAKVEENTRVIADLRRQRSEQQKLVNGLKTSDTTELRSTGTGKSDEDLVATQAKLDELQKAIDAASAQRDEATSHASALETKVTELTQLVRDREQALDQKEGEVAKQQELLEHDRDIRELMGARDLYMAEIHDVSKAGTGKTYGRVFYTKGKSLIFYAYDLDAQPGVLNASTFQAWGRRGPDKQQAQSLGIFYEDNLNKKRWVLKANDPRTLEDIDAVFVTVEPSGGSHHPSGKQLLFAYLRVSPNHP